MEDVGKNQRMKDVNDYCSGRDCGISGLNRIIFHSHHLCVYL